MTTDISARLKGCKDSVSTGFWLFMLPDANSQPAGFTKSFIRLTVSDAIPLVLGWPIPFIGCWSRSMLNAAMPKTTINKDGNLGPGEHDIGFSPKGRQRPSMDRISKAPTMKRTSKGKFRTRVPTRLSAHFIVY